jgi:hypothetical protein
MTFIASVIAKKGVAIIADSLVTTMKAVLPMDAFLQYIHQKTETSPDSQVLLAPDEVTELFIRETSHTKDFEDKLFQYGKYAAVTTAGSAWINSRKIEQIVTESAGLHQAQIAQSEISLEETVENFRRFIENEVKEHLSKEHSFGGTTFIFTSYDPSQKKTTIYTIDANETSAADLEKPDFVFVSAKLAMPFEKIVCEGQNRISHRILYGELEAFSEVVPKIVRRIFEDFKIDSDVTEYSKSVFENHLFSNQIYVDDMKMWQLEELSLQQAVDLAYLLMKIEMDFQKYTKNIPTVGGVVKVATISDEGFRFIAGDEIQARTLN